MQSRDGYVRFDFLFSYWIFAWFLIYYNIDSFNNKYATAFKRHVSPLLPLWMALFFNIYELIYVMMLKFDIITFIKYCIMFLTVKALPIYLLYRKGISIHWINDIIVTLLVVTVYVFYLYLNNTNPSKIYEETEKSIVNGSNKTPMFYAMNKIYSLWTAL